MKKNSILRPLLVLAVFSYGIAQEKDLNPMEYSMNNQAALMLEYPEIKSVSIGIYKDGKTYTGYYGEIDKGKENPATNNSLFEIASVTKTFTGILVAQAVLDGKLALKDDIRDHLEGNYTHLEYKNRPIQIRDLLTHTSGIRRDFSPTLSKLFDLSATPEEKQAIRAYDRKAMFQDLKQFRLDTIPGKRYDYSPIIGPELLAVILEKAYQKPYAKLLDELIQGKAGMEHTSMIVDEENKAQLVQGYTDDGKLVPPVPLVMTGAGAALKSSVPDMLKYAKYLLESSDPVIKEMRKPLFVDEEEGDQYGYFWHLGDSDFMHNGGTNGSTNWLILLPEYNVGFTVFFNSNGKMSGRLINRIAGEIYDDMEMYPKKNAYFSVRKKILKNTQEGIQYYHQLKKEKIDDFNFEDQSMLNKIGYQLLGENKNHDAITVFKLLVSEFPNASNPYDSLGEAYFMNEQYDLSLVNYKKSFALNPENNNAEKMIEKLMELKEKN